MVAGGPEAPTKPKVAPVPAPPRSGPAKDEWRLTLREAIRIGVAHCEIVQVVSKSTSAVEGAKPDAVEMTISRSKSDTPDWKFRAELMAHVRSIEQQYWALSQQQIQLWSREKAVKIGVEILRRERDKLSCLRGTAADVAEAQQNLERFQLAYVTATSDTITNERQLRNILGLPPADDRRIVPATAPLEAKYEPDWEASLAAMMANQPDIFRQRELVAKAEQARTAADAAKSAAPVGLPAEVVGVFGGQAAKVEAGRQREALQQAIHQATHALARFFLEVDANYKQFQTAKRLRDAAGNRIESALTYYEEGRTGFTVDKLLDAVSQYSDAIVTEAQYKTAYNTAIAAFGEAKGTLLDHCKIAVVEPDSGTAAIAIVRKWRRPRSKGEVLKPAVDFDINVKPAAFGAEAPKPVAPKADTKPSGTIPGGRVIKYDIAIEGGPLPIGLKGTVSSTASWRAVRRLDRNARASRPRGTIPVDRR